MITLTCFFRPRADRLRKNTRIHTAYIKHKSNTVFDLSRKNCRCDPSSSGDTFNVNWLINLKWNARLRTCFFSQQHVDTPRVFFGQYFIVFFFRSWREEDGGWWLAEKRVQSVRQRYDKCSPELAGSKRRMVSNFPCSGAKNTVLPWKVFVVRRIYCCFVCSVSYCSSFKFASYDFCKSLPVKN